MHCGPTGAGHFAKMVHNGIEYGLMQAYAEGFDILKNVGKGNVPENEGFEFNLTDLAEVWRRGSVVASWLLDLTALALARSPTLVGVLWIGVGLRRGTLDRHGGDRGGRPCRRADGCSLYALSLPSGAHLCGTGPVGDAVRIWWPHGKSLMAILCIEPSRPGDRR